MRLSARGWAWLLLALLACALFLHMCVRIVPADAPMPHLDASPAKAQADNMGLLIPVSGVSATALIDTFAQSRQHGAWPHDAIDIMAARGTPVVAAADGRIDKLFWSGQGGRTLYQRAADGRRLYYYAHLDSYAPGLREGQHVTRGMRIATVGSTGNADPVAPHLHFAVHIVAPADPWYGGRPVNPYPLFVAVR